MNRIGFAEQLAEQIVEKWNESNLSYVMKPDDVIISIALLESLSKIRLARSQYLGCGGNLSDSEVITAIHAVLDE